MIELIYGDGYMKNLLNDLISFIQSIKLMDLFFFGSIIVLIILIVVLIYIIRLNNDSDGEDMIDIPDEPIKNNEVEENELDLANIANAIEEEEPKPIVLNNYEKEQESKAIISYDELVATTNKPEEEINYKKEEDIEGLTVKALDLENLTKPVELPKMKDSATIDKPQDNNRTVLISYEKEEAFLETLKKLQSLLN